MAVGPAGRGWAAFQVGLMALAGTSFPSPATMRGLLLSGKTRVIRARTWEMGGVPASGFHLWPRRFHAPAPSPAPPTGLLSPSCLSPGRRREGHYSQPGSRLAEAPALRPPGPPAARPSRPGLHGTRSGRGTRRGRVTLSPTCLPGVRGQRRGFRCLGCGWSWDVGAEGCLLTARPAAPTVTRVSFPGTVDTGRAATVKLRGACV